MTDMVNLYAAKTNLSKLVARRGDRHRQSGSSRRPSWFRISRRKKKRQFGQNLFGITYIAEDFDGPLSPELQKYFE
jgi:hypothetical protein